MLLYAKGYKKRKTAIFVCPLPKIIYNEMKDKENIQNNQALLIK